jgi:hypothetical protein
MTRTLSIKGRIGLLGAVLVLTAVFGLARVESLSASSGGCCANPGCNWVADTCNGDGDCRFECCIGGCL